MSHFTYMKTHFQNIFYLEKALNRLNITYKQQETLVSKNLVIPQSNGYDISFCWNEDKYELVFDKSFWEQPYPIDQFINNIAQQYAGEVVIGESQKIGFKPIEYQQNVDGSRTVVLERWN